ncbi:signal recognition particle-docking protein FtsY [Roseitranquillus sediminis]|uniref:signal recognition particle-docking protein FtsY n=1 Tax=Roseitranquillus sediminis TaxID=2809051 RepID=UPI001D0C534F|nr:signal recognition particle-docking protein FtsY [Roseitranquillus sediminis]MBM9594663.1 signal recognition particle-docking protein FtsY [Roseitranquillus sediminis]
MSFFGKLKDRLFKSSSKLEEGLDAIVAEGGEVAASDVPDPGPPAPGPDIPPSQPTPTEPDLPPGEPPVPGPGPEPGPDEVPPSTPDPVRPPETEPTPAEEPEPVPPATPEEVPQDVPQPEEPPVREPQPAPEPPGVPPREPEPTRQTPPMEVPPTPGGTVADAPASPAAESPRPGFFDRLLGRGRAAAPVIRRTLDDDMLESLEELLISADMGVDTALRVTANLAEGHFGRKLSVEEIKGLLSAEIARVMEAVARPMPLYPRKPQVVLVVGVNGSGKTTTIGKLASQFRAAGKSVIIAAGDTFRAAAVEQLQVWGERAGVPVMKAEQGTDPASLAFDALTRAQAEGTDLLMIDTAGRLQNRADLMEELAKIVRVLRKKDPDAPHNTILVLDATTGQNALSQVETFRRMADVSGLVMTKLDGTAKGGVLVALADRFGLPIHAIGVGEQIDDLQPFDPQDFARALTGAAA